MKTQTVNNTAEMEARLSTIVNNAEHYVTEQYSAYVGCLQGIIDGEEVDQSTLNHSMSVLNKDPQSLEADTLLLDQYNYWCSLAAETPSWGAKKVQALQSIKALTKEHEVQCHGRDTMDRSKKQADRNAAIDAEYRKKVQAQQNVLQQWEAFNMQYMTHMPDAHNLWKQLHIKGSVPIGKSTHAPFDASEIKPPVSEKEKVRGQIGRLKAETKRLEMSLKG